MAAFDGRLDNREELIEALDLPRQVADVEVVCHAYLRWRLSMPGRLLGDFALALWHREERRLLLARDIVGLRPLCYRATPGAFSWASEARCLLPDAPAEPNEAFVAEHLADRIGSTTETLYAGVTQLAPAHAMTVSERGDIRTWRYWEPSVRELHGRDHREHDEQLWAVLRQSVYARLRCAGGATLSLSSGMDSGAIAAHVAALRDSGVESAGRVRAMTLDAPVRSEVEGARETAQWLGLSWERVDPWLTFSERELRADTERMRAFPEQPNSKLAAPLRARARERGHRVMLYGLGSDSWLHGWHWTVADLMARGRLLSAGRWMHFLANCPDPAPVRSQLWLAAWTLVPGAAKRALRRMLRRDPVPEWMEPAFARRVGLAERIRAAQEHRWLGSYAATEMFAFGTCGEQLVRVGEFELLHAYAGLEMRCPFYDRRLIELALSLPPDVRSTAGVPKASLRRSVAMRLPPRVAAAPPDPPGEWSSVHALERLGLPGRIRDLQPVHRGWVVPDRVEARWRSWRAGGEGFIWPIWGMTAIDFWMRAESTVRAHEVQEVSHGAGTARRFGS